MSDLALAGWLAPSLATLAGLAWPGLAWPSQHGGGATSAGWRYGMMHSGCAPAAEQQHARSAPP